MGAGGGGGGGVAIFRGIGLLQVFFRSHFDNWLLLLLLFLLFVHVPRNSRYFWGHCKYRG